MRTRGKVAVTIPRELLAEIERLRKRSGETRSAVFERALSAYLAAAGRSAQARQYVQGYRRRPEGAAERKAALARALAALAAEPFDAKR